MENAQEPLVVGVRFSKVGKVYHFAADAITDIKVGDQVVVETSRGWQLGQVAQIIPNADPPPEGWKPIDRRATPRDLLTRQMWQMKESDVVASCKTRSSELRLQGIKIVSAEYSFDGARLTIFFSSESEEKYELKSLRGDMQKMFSPSQVELRQIGPRDVAKIYCGMGACGLETRCCCLFLTEFSSISIRMAKEQGISLTPTEITGMCGRLRCCLIYEYDTYVEARSKLPKRNKRVRTPQGEGKVVDVSPLRGSVYVDIPEQGVREFAGNEVQLVDGDGGGGGGAGGQSPAGTGQPGGSARSGEGNQPAPYRGSQQPSEMDQAITGDETVHPFEVGVGDQPALPADWENPPSVTQPRNMPAQPERPRPSGGRQDRQRPGGKPERREGDHPPGGHDRPAGRGGGRGPRGGQGTSGADTAPGTDPAAGAPAEGSRPPRDRGSRGGRRPGRGGGSGGASGTGGAGSTGGAGGAGVPGAQSSRPQGGPGDRASSRPQGPAGPGGPQEGSGPSNPGGSRDQRRRRGRRPDRNGNNEERA